MAKPDVKWFVTFAATWTVFCGAAVLVINGITVAPWWLALIVALIVGGVSGYAGVYSGVWVANKLNERDNK